MKLTQYNSKIMNMIAIFFIVIISMTSVAAGTEVGPELLKIEAPDKVVELV